MDTLTSEGSVDDNARGGHEPSPPTRWILLVVALFGALIPLSRSDAPIVIAGLVIVAALVSCILVRFDVMHARGTLDRWMVLWTLLAITVLVAAALVLAQRADNAAEDLEAAEANLSALEGEIAELDELNRELQEQEDRGSEPTTDTGPPVTDPDEPISSSTTTASTSTTQFEQDEPPVFNSGSYTLADDEYFNLEEWEEWSTIDETVDIGVEGGTLATANAAQIASVSEESHAACAATANWSQFIYLTNIEPGTSFCLKTNTGRIASLTVTTVNLTWDRITFVGTVWDSP